MLVSPDVCGDAKPPTYDDDSYVLSSCVTQRTVMLQLFVDSTGQSVIQDAVLCQ